MRVSPSHLPYTPQYPLWSDGAAKYRWVFIPPGTHVDAGNAENWSFPVGTRFFKEFSFSRRIETRLIERTAKGWTYGTYVWNEEGTEATLAPEAGFPDFYEYEPGMKYSIPSTDDCVACHEGRPAFILGFSPLQLSPDRDPNAPHLEPKLPGMVDLESLVERGLVQGLPRKYLNPPPRIPGTPVGRSALGYLHGNCGNCHNSSGPLASLGLHLWHDLDARSEAGEPAVRTAVNRLGKWGISGLEPGGRELIVPGAPSRSTLYLRMAARDPIAQMPPMASRKPDAVALRTLERWIRELPTSPQPRRKP
ncbi:MAG: hypothetical protein ACYC8T_09085 [Myxococcaceae bacterium]